MYFEDIRLIHDHDYMKRTYGKSSPDRYVLKETRDSEGIFWECLADFSVFPFSGRFTHRRIVCIFDIFEELNIWCDLNGITIYHIERLNDDLIDN